MRCDEIQPQLGAYVDGELTPQEAEAVATHLETCRACHEEGNAVRHARERVSALPRVKAPAALAAAVAAKVSAIAVKHPEDALSAFLDGELQADEHGRVLEHVGSCAPCSASLAGINGVVVRVRALPRRSAPAELLPRVLAELWSPRRRQPPSQPFDFGPSVKRFFMAASFLVLAVGAAAFSTPNTNAGVAVGSIAEESIPVRPQEPARAPRSDTTPPRLQNPELVVALLTTDPSSAFQNLESLGREEGFATASTFWKDTYSCEGPAEALRQIATAGPAYDLRVEDMARLDALVQEPTDRITTRSGEHLFGWCEREDPQRVVFCSNVRSQELPDPASIGPGHGLLAEYFDLDETPPTVADGFRSLGAKAACLVRVEPAVDFSTPGYAQGKQRFGIARTENFAVRFRGYYAAQTAGVRTFALGSDDGGLLEVDHRSVCGVDGNHGYAESSAPVELSRGFHAITILYFNGGGPGACRLLVAEPGQGLAPAPQRLLYDPDRVERGARVVSVALPRRSIVKLERASREPLRILVQLRRRTD